MNSKIPLVLILVCIFASQIHISQANASIKPIITTQMPKKLTIGLQETNLSWFVIDDNLESFTIYINGLLWKNRTVTSNLIEEKFSNVVGSYNLTLEVYDYSNNTAFTNMTIIVSAIEPTTTTSSNITSYIIASQAAPAFTIFEFMLSITLLMSSIKIAHFKNRKKLDK